MELEDKADLTACQSKHGAQMTFNCCGIQTTRQMDITVMVFN